MDQPNRRRRMALGILLSISLVLIFSISLVRAQTAPPEAIGIPPIIPADTMDQKLTPGVVLLQFEPGMAMSRAQDLALSLPGVQGAETLTAGIYRMAVEPGSEIARAAQWREDPRVRVAEPDYLFYTTATPNDTYFTRYQWNLRHIRAEQGWDQTIGNGQVIIAVIDTGVDLTHPDLVGKIVPGYDFVNNDADPSDDQGHGTHVASIAAANSNNGQGIAGVAWGTSIMPIKVLDANGAGRSSNVAQAITWAVDHGAQIINLSLGGSNYSDLVAAAIQNAYERGVLVIAAAGNHYKAGNPIIYPAAHHHVLAVAAINDQDGHASYSSSGSFVDVAAPGGDPNGALDVERRHWIPGAYWRGSGISYAWLSGTSQAAPHVTGLAALLLSTNSGLTPDQLSEIIIRTAVDIQLPGWDEFSGSGRIDIPAALAAVPPIIASPPTPTPTFTATPTPSPTPLPPALLRPRQDRRINSVSTNHQDNAALTKDSNGNLTTIWRDGRNGSDALYSAHLSATEVDWGVNQLITGVQSRSADILSPPFLATAPDGTIHALWRSQSGSGQTAIYHSYQPQAGAAWIDPLPIVNETTAITASARPLLAAITDGTLLAVWGDQRDGASTDRAIYWSERQPGRADWSAPATILTMGADSQREAAIAVGSTGVYVAWVSRSEEKAMLILAHRDLSTAEWFAPLMGVALNPHVDTHSPALIVDPQGGVTLAWADQRAEETGLDIYAIQKRANAEWSSIVRVNDDSGESDQRHPQLGAGEQGLVLAWEDERLGDPDIFIAWQMADNPIWSPNRRANQDGRGVVQRAPDVAIDDDGHTTIVWTDYRTGNNTPEIYTRFIPFGERFTAFLPTVAGP